jgi:phosphoglucomutase
MLDNYKRWLESENTDPILKKQLKEMSQKQINDAFYTNIEFGTAGMRGIMEAGSNRINIHTIRKANVGFAEYIAGNGEQACKKGVAISYDNRYMSKEFAMDSARILASYNIKSYVFESLRPTPELSFAVRYLKCFGGIMITASHNPKEYNGYKLYDDKGCQLVPVLAKQVIDNVNAVEDELSINPLLTTEQEKLINIIGKEIDEIYLENVLNIRLNKDVNKDIKIIFSPEHGASNLLVQETFKRAGYNYILVEEQATFDPEFSGTESPNPENIHAYDLSLEYAKKNDADLILVCDPDGDRMGVGIKHDGQYVIMTGNQSGAVLLEYILYSRKALNKLPENSIMFNTVVTSDLGEKVASKYGVETEKTLTGFKFIGEKVAKYEINDEKTYVFGYEESYGSLISPFVRDKDATQACLMLAEAAAFYKEKGMDLIDVLDGLYKELGSYDESQISIVLSGQAGAEKIKAIIDNLRTNPLKEVNGFKIIAREDYGKLERVEDGVVTSLVGFTKSEVLKYFLEDGSWIAVRPSGTEPKLKFYFCVKDCTMKECKSKATKFQDVMKKLAE